MAKKTLIALAAPLFASYHKVNVFHFTSDNCPFFDEYSAKNHACTLTDKSVTPVTRDEAIETIELTDEEAEETFKQLLADNRKEFADLFGFDAADQLTWQELDAAILCHKQFVDRLIEGFETSIHDGLGKLLYKIVAIPQDLPVTPESQIVPAGDGLKADGFNLQDVIKGYLDPADSENFRPYIFVNGVLESDGTTTNLTDNQPAPTNNDVASDAAGSVQEPAPAAKAATEEKPATVKKPKAPKAKPAVEPVAAEQAEKAAGEQPAAEQPTEPAAEQPTENN